MKKIKAMVLAEVMFALFICGILIGISIYMFKSMEVKVSPYIYQVLDSIPKANTLVSDECFRVQTCEIQYVLPDNTAEYCTRLSDQFVTTGDVFCSVDGDINSQITVSTGSGTTKKYGRNFTLTNGVSFYGLNPGAWSKDGYLVTVKNNTSADSSEWTSTTSNVDRNHEYIDFFIKVGKKADDIIGENVFPLRMMKDGEVIPGPRYRKKLENITTQTTGADGTVESSTSSELRMLSDYSYGALDDEELLPYRIIVNNRAQGQWIDIRQDATVDAKEAINKRGIDSDKLPFREKMSFREATCASNPDYIKIYYNDDTDCEGISRLASCEDGIVRNFISNNSYCYVAPYKPRGAGIFKIFGL